MSLLYNLTLLHSLAKMCMVGGDTLERMDQVTTRLGHLMQRFQSETCVRYTTYELPKEDPVKPRSDLTLLLSQNGPKAKPPKTPVQFSLRTPKWHFIGDYSQCIRARGTMDNYSTEPVSPGSAMPSDASSDH
ncbi:hypothetical protein CALCODRAFT_464642 [Calocera cornea HHB12733]|uniref:Uncharacterized protein n=1 Tax=Calocera cornea HHB12733 TaxID=1353952 RepID=A0A165IUD9_9BASI|nr:hypothetical protein CALCODRAFT_464642 [Calocera cornea HHB12733]